MRTYERRKRVDITDIFVVNISDNRMKAEIDCTETYKQFSGGISKEQLKQLLTLKQIVHGIDFNIFTSIIEQDPTLEFPVTIASGTLPEDGLDGYVTYTYDENVELKENSKSKAFDFRDIMRIPSVNENDEIAVETLPTKGKPGKNVSGITIKPRPGKRKNVRAGKNVRYDESTHTYYARAEGQVSVQGRVIEVHDLFVVTDTLSMKTGNIDFVGSVEIHGDVPTGYTVKAGGDIRVFGLVEAATLIAGGSVYISEGFAGLQKGEINAQADVHVSYVNQGCIQANGSIYVENSILHSDCSAENAITCKRGDIIGGIIKAGVHIQARDIGNRVQTKTKVIIHQDEQIYEKEATLKEKLKEVRTTIRQLTLIGENLEKSTHINDPKMRVTLLRQKSSLQQVLDQEDNLQDEISYLQMNYFHDGEASVNALQTLHGNVTIAFGKYEQTTQKEYDDVQCRFHENELTILPLS